MIKYFLYFILSFSCFGQSRQVLDNWLNVTQPVNISSSIVMDGLVRWWKFDETSGNISTDSVNGFTLTNTSVVITNGKWGNAIYMNGSSTSKGANITDINTNDLSISMWVNVPYVGSARWLFNQWEVSPYRGPAFYVTTSLGGTWYFQVGSNYEALNLADPMLTNQWVHFVCTATAGSPATLQMFTNGVLAKMTANYKRVDAYHTDPFNVGGPTEGSVNPLIGYVDNLRVYNRILTTNEIQQLYLNP